MGEYICKNIFCYTCGRCTLKEEPKPKCFYGDKEKCMGYSKLNDDEPVEKCKICRFQTSYEKEADGNE